LGSIGCSLRLPEADTGLESLSPRSRLWSCGSHTTAPRASGFGLLVTIALFEFRAQIFLLFAPALAMTVLWETDFIQRHVRLIISAILISIIVSVLCIVAMPAAREAWLHFSAFRTFLEIVHTGQRPTAYDGVYLLIGQRFGQVSAYIVGLCALVPVALGALTFAWPLGLIVAIRRTGWQPLDSFPVWCLAIWLGLVLLAPKAGHGDFSEYQHRPFVLVYAVTLVWTLLYMDRAIDGTRLGFSWVRPLLLALVIAFLVSELAWPGPTIRLSRVSNGGSGTSETSSSLAWWKQQDSCIPKPQSVNVRADPNRSLE
jgi:hypothetical protein